MAEQICSEVQRAYGGYMQVPFPWGTNKVPAQKILEIHTITLNYFPSGSGTLGRADLIGRDANGNAAWRLQVVYVKPHETRHLTFPKGLRLEAGGFVELGFIQEGPGDIFASFNGVLLRK